MAEVLEPRPYSVKEVTRLVKQALESNPHLANVFVRGEVSNFRHQASSGHMYFTLKDESASLRCVMFRSRNVSLLFKPADGMRVVAQGTVNVYEAGGEYQLYVSSLYPDGIGDLYLAYQQLKERLAQEGLFAEELKRSLPRFPRVVGVVTSPTGAAIRDIINVATRRDPGVRLILAPAIVQGDEGPASVVRAIQTLQRIPEVEVMIVGRGGGSLEDLWTFNDERVARAIRESRIPVVSAVGHETDFTIADFVADRRAPTPSAAAELVVMDRSALGKEFTTLAGRLRLSLRQGIALRHQRLLALSASRSIKKPLERIAQLRQRVDEKAYQINLNAKRTLGRAKEELRTKEAALANSGSGLVKLRRDLSKEYASRLTTASRRIVPLRRQLFLPRAGALDALSPLATLARGYSVCRRPDGTVVRRATQLAKDDVIEVVLSEGRADCRVLEVDSRSGFTAATGEESK